MGRRRRPFYRIVVIDSRKPRDGRYIDALGIYDPLTKPAKYEVDESKALEWLKKGAIPSDTVRNIFQKKGIALKWHLIRMGSDESKINGELQKFQMLQNTKAEKALIGRKKKGKKSESAGAESAPAVGVPVTK